MKVAVIGRTEILYELINELLFMGHKVTCIITAKEAPEYTKKRNDFKDLAFKHGIPFSDSTPILKNYSLIENSESDIAFSINYPGIIPKSIIELFKFGILNAHGGDLPKYRGNSCQAWAILNGEERIGLCIHKMIGDKLDAGDIISRSYYPINIDTKITEVYKWIEINTAKLFIEALDNLKDNPKFILESQSNKENHSLRCFPLQPSDGLINWDSNNVDVLRRINAFNKPFQGAFTFLDSKKFIIWDAQLIKDKFNFCAVPGQVIRIKDGFIEVACRKSIIRLSKVEYNEEINNPDKFIRSIRSRFENL